MVSAAALPLLLPWHQPQWRSVVGRWQRRQFPHALLLYGAPGVGKGRFVRRLAQLLLCSAHDAAVRPCAVCRACRLNAAGSHPDLFEISLLEGKKQLLIEQIRVLIEGVSLTPYYSGYKVAIINPAGGMSAISASVLLKTLEEPPGETVFLLVVDSGRTLLPTIRSRCQRLNFPLPQRQPALAWLHDVLGDDVTKAQGETLLDLAGGAPLRACDLHHSEGLAVFAALKADLQALADASGSAQPASSNAIAAKWHSAGASQVVSLLHRIAAHLARSRYAPAREEREFTTVLPQQARRLSAQALLELYDHTDAARFSLLAQPMLNERLLIEQLAYMWRRVLTADTRRRT